MNNQLCYITRDGQRIKCVITEAFIPSLFHLLPLVAVRGLNEPLNAINRIYVPMTDIRTLDQEMK